MSFEPSVKIVKSGDRLTVSVLQKYFPRGLNRERYEGEFPNIKRIREKPRYRWRIAGVFSLKELRKEEG